MTFNVLIATIGRPTLQIMLDSLSPQLEINDCLTIVFDGFATPPKFNTCDFKCKVNIHCELVALGFHGHGIRNKYASILERRDFVMHADDDDKYAPNSFNKLRNLCTNTDSFYIARMTSNGVIIPSFNNQIYVGNIGTPCGIIPYELNKKELWGKLYGGDGEFYTKLITHVNPLFLDEVIYIVK